MLDEEANALEELQTILSKTRNKITSSKLSLNSIIKEEEAVDESKDNGIAFEKLNTIVEEEDRDHLTLDTMSEFCRNLGNVPGKDEGNINEDDDDEDIPMETGLKKKEKSHKKHESSDSEDEEHVKDDSDNDEDESVNASINKSKLENDDEEFDLLDDEPVLDRGLAACLNLCVNKGYIEKEKSKQNARFKKESIEAINYTVEEKNYYDIDDKYNRNRDRFSGPLSDFQEKPNYKPEVKLDYIDEKGHEMNEKEAFRYLSHRFHGKGSGKKKTEKQYKKIKEMEVMNKMSSIDTPLNTVALLVEKQKKLQQPFVVLSTSKSKQDQ